MKKPQFLESPFTQYALILAGVLLLAIGMVQLPLVIYFQNTKPAIDWRVIETTAEGFKVVSFEGEVEGDFSPLLQEGDIITEFAGKRLDSASRSDEELEVWHHLMGISIGDTVHFSVLRDGDELHLSAVCTVTRAELLGSEFSMLSYLPNNVAPLVSVLIAFVILFRQPRARLSSLFALVSYSIAFHMLVTGRLNAYMPWWQEAGMVGYIGSELALLFFFAFLVHFMCIFPQDRKIRGSMALRNWFIYLPPVLLSVFIYVIAYWLKIVELQSWISYTAIGYMVLYSLIGLAVLISSYRRAESPAVKKVVSVLATGVGLFAVGFLGLMALQLFFKGLSDDIRLWLSLTLVLITTFSMPLSFGYAILRYGFLDVRVLVKQATVYFILSGVVIVGFVSIFIGLDQFSSSFTRKDVLFVALIMSGIVLLALVILKDKLQEFVNKKLFRKEFERANRLRAFSHSLLHHLDRDKLLNSLTSELPGILEVRSADVCRLGGPGNAHLLSGNHCKPEVLSALDNDYQVRQLLHDGDIVLPTTYRSLPYDADVHALLPIQYDEAGKVLLALGEKQSGYPLTDEELELLRSVADHAALGWRNAGLSEDMRESERMKKEVEIAQAIQSEMMPHAIPHIPGIEIASYSVPARDVGGDFFDLIPLQGDKLGLVVGDVSDKGISAAMVMASSISTLRFAAESGESPRKILEIANRRLYNDTRKQMFVAVYLGVLDTANGRLSFTNAGLPKPMLYRDGEAFLIDWSENGAHLPLGAKPDTIFHEQSMDIQRGDILILYTDGVFESMNEQGEEFGIKRLNAVVKEHAHEPGEKIVEAINIAIHDFTGTQALFDDLTLVVVKIS